MLFGFHNFGFNHDLSNRNVEPLNDFLDLLERTGGVQKEQLIGARLGHDRATRTEPTRARCTHTAARRLQALRYVQGFGIFQSNAPGLQVFSDICARTDPQHAFFGCERQTFGLHHHIHGFSPRHVFEMQSDGTAHAIGHDQIVLPNFGQSLQQGFDFHVLKGPFQLFIGSLYWPRKRGGAPKPQEHLN